MNFLLRHRKAIGLTQTDVENVTGIDTSTLSLYENGFRIPTVENAKKLGKLMGFDWTLIFKEGETDDVERV